MTTETEHKNESLSNAIETKREEVKEQFGLNDEEFNLLIRSVILDSFDKLRIRLSADDPIFAVVLAQKNVMDYYASMITNALNSLPKQIGNAVDSRLEELSETINVIGEAFDNELSEFKKSFTDQTLELNNQIISNFSTFIDKKLIEIKTALDKTSPQNQALSSQYQQFENEKANKSIFKALILIFTLFNMAIAGLTLYTVYGKNTNKDEIVAYQMGLFKGFEEVRKKLPKEADKVQNIVIEAIDKELKAR